MFRKKIIVCMAFLLNVAAAVNAQNGEQDSLRTVLRTQESDTNRVNTLLRLAWILRAENPQESMKISLEAQTLSDRLKFDKGKAMALSTIGVLHYRKGDLIAATNAHMQALTIRKNMGDDNGVARSYINLGNIYSDQQNNALALQHYMGAMELLEGSGDDARLGSVYLNIGGIYLAENNNTEAAKYCNRTAELARKIEDPLLEAQALNNAGVCYEHLGKLDSAMLAYQQSYSIAEAQSEKVMMVDAGMNIGNVFRLRKEFDKAIAEHKTAEETANEMGYVEGLRGVYECLAADYQSKGDYESAFNYEVLFKKFSDSIYNEENSIKMVEISSRFAQEKKEMELRKAELELGSHATKETGKKAILLTGVIAIVSICAAVGFIVVVNRNRKRERLLIEAQDQEIVRLRTVVHNLQQPDK